MSDTNAAYDLPCVTRVLAIASDGADLGAINDSLAAVVKAMRDRYAADGGKVKGELSMKIALEMTKSGVEMTVSHTRKIPLPPAGGTRLYINDAKGVLTLQGTTPRLPFQEIDARFGAQR